MDNNLPMGTNQQPGGFPPASPTRPTTPPPTPPPPEITLRTMQSDMESLKQTGGAGSAPKPFTPPELTRDFARPAVPPPPMPKIPQSDFASARPAAPAMPSSMPAVAPAPKIEMESTGSNWKKLLLWGAVLVLIIGAGIAGYMFIYPMLFPQIATPPAPIVTPPQTNASVPAPVVVNTPPAAPQMLPHTSLLAPGTPVAPVILPTIDLTSFKLALQNEAQKTAAPDSLVETTLNDAGGQIASSKILPLMLPAVSAAAMQNLFADDFTTALYYDANGAWPVYILAANAGQVSQMQAMATSLESSKTLANLFLTNPGTESAAGFKSGKIGTLATRYLAFSKTGASLNIAVSGNNLILSTSYNGLKKTLGALAQ